MPPLRTLVVMDLCNTLSFVAPSKFCLFTDSLNPWSADHLHKHSRLFTAFLCSACLQYVLWVSTFLSLLSSKCALEILTVSSWFHVKEALLFPFLSESSKLSEILWSFIKLFPCWIIRLWHSIELFVCWSRLQFTYLIISYEFKTN